MRRPIKWLGIALMMFVIVLGFVYFFDGNEKTVNGQASNPYKKVKTESEGMKAISSTDDLLDYFEKARKLDSGPRYFSMVESEQESAMDDASSGGGDYSSTNVQVDGVDESDIVKTDGDYLYAIFGGMNVKIVDIRNASKMKIVSQLKQEEDYYPSQLFLHGDLLLVLGEKMDRFPEKVEETTRYGPVNSYTTVRIYNVKDRGNPVFLREIGAEGYLKSARKTEDTLYLVTNLYPNFWAMEELEGDQLRPVIIDSEGEKEKSFMGIEDIAILPGAIEPSYSVITAIDLSSPKTGQFKAKGFLGSSEQLYMNKDHLYLTATNYERNIGPLRSDMRIWDPGKADTEFFKFSLDGTAISFTASTELKGTVLNQFSMDEYNGNFRVVMTEGNIWDEKNPSKNHLYMLDEDMKMTGSVEGLAKGERIYSARFMGDKAYMVTFRETDPLFVIDVADPSKPKVLGELKIPGFSNYLHPLDENHLIGFGYDTEARKNPSGGEPIITTKGMKISLFDVTDFNNPKEKFTEIIGGQGTHSPIQYDHKALMQHKNRNLFGFPVSIYEETGKSNGVDFKGAGARVYEITPDRGIVLKGNLVKGKAAGQLYEEWETQVQRLIYSGDAVYTLATHEVKSFDLNSFKEIGVLQMN